MLIRALHPMLLFSPDEGGGGDGGSGGGSGDGAPQTFTQQQVNDLIAREKGKIQQKYGDYDDLRSKATRLDEITNASRSDIERLTGERDTLKGQHGSLTAQNMRLKVALKLGLVGDRAEIADLLQGANEAEMEEHGKKLAAMFGGGTGFDGGARGNGDGPLDMNAMIRRAAGRG